MSCLELLNQFFKTYTPTLDAFDKLISIAISVGLFCLARRANDIAKSNLELAKQEKETRVYRISQYDRELFRSCYTKLTEAIAIVFREGRVNDEAKAMFWQARDQARLELPEDIYKYTETLFDKMWEAYCLGYNQLSSPKDGGLGLPAGSDERKAASKRHMDLINDLAEERPFEIFSPYLKVKLQ